MKIVTDHNKYIYPDYANDDNKPYVSVNLESKEVNIMDRGYGDYNADQLGQMIECLQEAARLIK